MKGMQRSLIHWHMALLLAGLAAGCFPSSQSTDEAATPNQPSPLITATNAATPPGTVTASPSSGVQSPSSPFSPGDQVVAQQPECTNPQTQVEINDCAAKSADVADQKLNDAYNELRAKLQPDQENLLIDAQRAWIEFRDKNCAFSQNRFEGGTIAPTVYSSCIERITQQRTEELQKYTQDGFF